MSLRLLLAGYKMHVSCTVRSFPGISALGAVQTVGMLWIFILLAGVV
jgi:hypothetical protein